VNNYVEIIVGIAVAILVVGGNILWGKWYLSRSRPMLDQWAERNRLEILYSQRQLFFLGRFFQTTFTGQVVYRVRVRDRHGKIRSGLVTCGGPFAPFLMDEARAKWDTGET
jgi:hypothetical protein